MGFRKITIVTDRHRHNHQLLLKQYETERTCNQARGVLRQPADVTIVWHRGGAMTVSEEAVYLASRFFFSITPANVLHVIQVNRISRAEGVIANFLCVTERYQFKLVDL